MLLLQKKTVSILLIGLLFLACKNETEEIKTNSVYITDVFEYVYAPGQHAPLAKATDVAYFKGDPAQQSKWLYLGGFGGYITAGFDHDKILVRIPGLPDDGNDSGDKFPALPAWLREPQGEEWKDFVK